MVSSYGPNGPRVSRAPILEVTPQFVARPVDIRLHGAQGQVQDAGDLLVAVPLYVAQQNARAVLGAESGDGLLDGAAQLARLELLQRRFTAVAQLQRRRPHFVRRGRVRRPVERERLELPLAEVIDRRVVG